MKNYLIFFLLLLLFLGCTITKRVHNPGYHIEWHKLKKDTAKKDHDATPIETNKQVNDSNVDHLNLSEVPNDSLERSEFTIDTDENSEPEIVSFKSQKSNESAASVLPVEKSDDLKNESQKQPSSVQRKKSKSPLFWRLKAKTLIDLGIVLMCLGGMILLASIFIFMGAFSGDGSGFWIQFLVSMIGLGGWFLALIFVLIIILIVFLFYLLIAFVLGGPIVGLMVGSVLLGAGILFYVLGKSRPKPE